MQRTRRTLALATTILVVPLVLIEIGFRLFAPQDQVLNISEWHPHYGWRNRPGARGFYATKEFRFEAAINSLGLRYREISRAKPSGTFRILGLGDSFLFGHGVASDSTFAAVAERLLAERALSNGRRLEIINAGVGKWGTAQEYLYLVREGFGLDPDLVLLAFCLDNDFENNLESPVLRLAGDSLVPVANPEPALRAAQRLTRAIPGYDFLVAHSHLVNFLRLRAAVATDRRITARTRNNGDGQAITFQIINAMTAACRDKQTPLVVLLIPSLAEVDPARWRIHQRPKDMDAYFRSVAGLTAHLDSIAVPWLDPRPWLRGPDPLYFAHDTHWNEAGNRIVGRYVADALIGTRIVPF